MPIYTPEEKAKNSALLTPKGYWKCKSRMREWVFQPRNRVCQLEVELIWALSACAIVSNPSAEYSSLNRRPMPEPKRGRSSKYDHPCQNSAATPFVAAAEPARLRSAAKQS